MQTPHTPPDERPREDRLRVLGIAMPVALVLLTMVLYAPVMYYGYTDWDDRIFVGDNPVLREDVRVALPAIFTPGGIPKDKLYTPLTYLSFYAERRIFGPQPQVPHTTNLCLHIINCLLVWLLIGKLVGCRFLAFGTALAFALHPIQVESVAWIMGRKDLLSATFGLICLLCFSQWLRDGCRRQYWFALFAYTAAVMGKPSLLVLPAALALLPPFMERPWRRLRDYTWSIPFIVAALILYTLNSMTSTTLAESAEAGGSPFFRMLHLPWLVQHWLELIGLAKAPNVFHGWPDVAAGAGYAGAGLVVMAIVVAAVWALIRGGKCIGWFGLLFFLIASTPAVLILVAGRIFITADHYMYFPSIGLFLLMFALAGMWRERRAVTAAVRVVLAAWLVCAAVSTQRYVGAWESGRTLWEDSTAKTPDTAFPWFNLAYIASQEGNKEEAIRHLETVRRFEPFHHDLYTRLALNYAQAGRYEEAYQYVRIALALDPEKSTARITLAKIYEHRGDNDAAINEYLAVLRHEKGGRRAPDVMIFLANLYFRSGQYQKALEQYSTVHELFRPGSRMQHFIEAKLVKCRAAIESASGASDQGEARDLDAN